MNVAKRKFKQPVCLLRRCLLSGDFWGDRLPSPSSPTPSPPSSFRLRASIAARVAPLICCVRSAFSLSLASCCSRLMLLLSSKRFSSSCRGTHVCMPGEVDGTSSFLFCFAGVGICFFVCERLARVLSTDHTLHNFHQLYVRRHLQVHKAKGSKILRTVANYNDT